jgi:hypothetical protein
LYEKMFEDIKNSYGAAMGEGLAKQAKTLTDKQIKRALAEVATHQHPERDRVMVVCWTCSVAWR